MLATLLIWLSVAVAVLALADLFLSQAQKTWLSNALIKTWSVLDEAKSWSFADWLKKPTAMWWLAASMALLISAGFILQQVLMMKWLEREIAQQGAPEYALHLDDFLKAAVFGIIVLFIARLIFARLLRFTSAKQLFGRLVIIFSFAAIAFYLLGIALDKLAFSVHACIPCIFVRPRDFSSTGQGLRGHRQPVRWRVRGSSHCRIPQRAGARCKRILRRHSRFNQSFGLELRKARLLQSMIGNSYKICEDPYLRIFKKFARRYRLAGVGQVWSPPHPHVVVRMVHCAVAIDRRT